MKQTGLIILLALLAVFAFYQLGKKTGVENLKTDLIQNETYIKEIAELSALEVKGVATIKMTNAANQSGVVGQLKKYFGENTLQISVPYTAKYGVDMGKQSVAINTKDSTVQIKLAPVKLLSMQMHLDQVDAISKTGLFRTESIADYIGLQKSLYAKVQTSLQQNNNYINAAATHINFILSKYYEPLGYKVTTNFGQPSKLN